LRKTVALAEAILAGLGFGAGRIADIGKGMGQGIKNFKQGLKEAEELDADKKVTEKQLPPAGGSTVTAVKEDGGAKA